ncbi:MAG: S41 family peptidase [Fimbriimonas sp.]
MKSRKTLLLALGVCGCFALGFSWRDIQRGELPSGRSVNNLFGVQRMPTDAAPDQTFKQNFNLIRSEYMRPVKSEDLKYAGIGGMVSSLGDPHTIFMVPRQAQAFNDETRANFFGVGARLQPDPLGARLFTVFDDGPAFRAGLRAGMIITAVDGKSVGGTPVDNIVSKIKGPEGTLVRLTVTSGKSAKPITFTVRRARILAPTVENGKYFAESKVGYLSLTQFSEPTLEQFDRELTKLEKRELHGLIIDLRGNGGGLLETAKDLLGRFVENKVVVKMKLRDGHEEVVKTPYGTTHDFDYPVVVLINEDSASASEIFAGCLRDYRKATLVGEHSYGKASVQNVFQLVDQASAKITIAKYFLPMTGDISRKVDEDGVYVSGGLKPDVEVELDPNAGEIVPGDPKTDNQLRKAIEVVLSKR